MLFSNTTGLSVLFWTIPSTGGIVLQHSSFTFGCASVFIRSWFKL